MKATITTHETENGIIARATLPHGMSFSTMVPYSEYAQLAGPGDMDELGRFGHRFKKFVKKVAHSKIVKELKKVGPILKRGIAAIPVIGPIADGAIDAGKAIAHVAKTRGPKKAKVMHHAIVAARMVRKAQGKHAPSRRRGHARAKLKALHTRAKRGDKHAAAQVAAVASALKAKHQPTAANKAVAHKARRALAAVEKTGRVIQRDSKGAIVRVPSGRKYRVAKVA